jgi:hypothetical protein
MARLLKSYGEQVGGEEKTSSCRFVIWALAFICHLDFDIWVYSTFAF